MSWEPEPCGRQYEFADWLVFEGVRAFTSAAAQVRLKPRLNDREIMRSGHEPPRNAGFPVRGLERLSSRQSAAHPEHGTRKSREPADRNACATVRWQQAENILNIFLGFCSKRKTVVAGAYGLWRWGSMLALVGTGVYKHRRFG